jgi:hypothetical protein
LPSDISFNNSRCVRIENSRQHALALDRPHELQMNNSKANNPAFQHKNPINQPVKLTPNQQIGLKVHMFSSACQQWKQLKQWQLTQ